MSNGKEMNPEVMKDRTKKFAKQIILLCRKLPKNREGNLIGNQIFRSGTSQLHPTIVLHVELDPKPNSLLKWVL